MSMCHCVHVSLCPLCASSRLRVWQKRICSQHVFQYSVCCSQRHHIILVPHTTNKLQNRKGAHQEDRLKSQSLICYKIKNKYNMKKRKRKRKQQKEIIQNLQLNNSGHSRVNFEGEKIVHPSVFQLGSQNYSKAPLKQKHQGTSRLPLSKKKKKKNQSDNRKAVQQGSLQAYFVLSTISSEPSQDKGFQSLSIPSPTIPTILNSFI